MFRDSCGHQSIAGMNSGAVMQEDPEENDALLAELERAFEASGEFRPSLSVKHTGPVSCMAYYLLTVYLMRCLLQVQPEPLPKRQRCGGGSPCVGPPAGPEGAGDPQQSHTAHDSGHTAQCPTDGCQSEGGRGMLAASASVPSPLVALSDLLLLRVLANLSPEDLLVLGQASRYFRIAANDGTLWRRLYYSRSVCASCNTGGLVLPGWLGAFSVSQASNPTTFRSNILSIRQGWSH